MAEYDEYNFDDEDDDDEEEEFEKKIYIDDDDDEEEEEDEDEGDHNEYEKKKQNYSKSNEVEYEEDVEVEDEEEEESIPEHIIVDEQEDVSDYEIKPKKSTSKKRQPKKSNAGAATEPPKKKPRRKSSVNSISVASETTTPIKIPTISEMNTVSALTFKGIPSAQENLKKKQIKQWCFVCPLCSKTAYNKQTFEQHLLLHDDFLTVLQVYYSEEDPVQCLNAAMEEWKIVETEYLKQDDEPEWMKHTTFKKDVILFKNKYYEYEEGKRMLFRKNAMDSLISKKVNNTTVEEQLKWKIFDEMSLKQNDSSKNK